MKKIIITIDGYSSCGKSTLARQLATKLNYVFIDSGAMYRAITLYFLRNHIDWNSRKKVMENIPLAALKLSSVIFYNFIDVPYLYLFYTSSFISLLVGAVVVSSKIDASTNQ